MNQKPHFIGIDISKLHLDVADSMTQETWQTANNEEGIAGLVESLSALNPPLIVLEATGGLEIPLASALVAGSTAGSRGQPATSTRFCQSHRKTGKNRCH